MLGILDASSPMVADVEAAKAIPTAPAAGERMPSHSRGSFQLQHQGIDYRLLTSIR